MSDYPVGTTFTPADLGHIANKTYKILNNIGDTYKIQEEQYEDVTSFEISKSLFHKGFPSLNSQPHPVNTVFNAVDAIMTNSASTYTKILDNLGQEYWVLEKIDGKITHYTISKSEFHTLYPNMPSAVTSPVNSGGRKSGTVQGGIAQYII